MHKTILLIFSLLFSMAVFSQKAAISFKNEDISRKTRKDAFTLSNSVTNELTILLVEKNEVYAYLFNNNFKLQSQFQTELIKSKYDEALGFKLTGTKQHILFSNNKKNRFAVLTLDFSEKTSLATELEFSFNNELYITSVNYKNSLYLLSISKDQEIIIREMTNLLDFKTVSTIKLNQNNIHLKENKNFSTFSLFGNSQSNIQKIDPRVPNPLELTSNANKIFQYDNLTFLTFEIENFGTLAYTINFDDLSHSIQTYKYPKGKLDDLKRFNSYISPQYFYQIASSKEEMQFLINDLSGTLIKKFFIKNGATISFKNGPIIQEGATAVPFVNRRELDQSSKYLRKITSGDLGIAVLQQDNYYYLTLGGYKIVNTGSGMMMTGGGVTSVGSTNVVIMNPTFYSYNMYASSKSTYFTSKFDKDFNHVKGKVAENAFEKIKTYSKKIKYITAEDTFFHNDQLYFGYFDMKKATYNVVPF